MVSSGMSYGGVLVPRFGYIYCRHSAVMCWRALGRHLFDVWVHAVLEMDENLGTENLLREQYHLSVCFSDPQCKISLPGFL